MFGSLLVTYYSVTSSTIVMVLTVIFLLIFIIGLTKITRAGSRMEFLLTTRHRDFLKSINVGPLERLGKNNFQKMQLRDNAAGYSVQIKGKYYSYFGIFGMPELFKELGDMEMITLAEKIKSWRLPTAASLLSLMITAGTMIGTEELINDEVYKSGITKCDSSYLMPVNKVEPDYPYTRTTFFGEVYEPMEGHVELKYVINKNGTVSHPVVTDSASYDEDGPGRDDFFVNAAIAAVIQWQFEKRESECYSEVGFRFELED